MIETLSRRFSVAMTPEDASIYLRSKNYFVVYQMRLADRRDAERMFMLTDSGPRAAAISLGLTHATKEESAAHRSGGLRDRSL